jgi:hypothetical protein
MATARPTLLAGWIGLALVAAIAGLAVRAGEPEHRVATVAQAPRVTTATVAPTTTLAPTTTTTTAPPPPPTTVPAPTTTAPRRVVAPAPSPSAPTPPTAVAGTSVVQQPAAAATPEYAAELLAEAVPGRWRAAIPVSFQVIAGRTSWSSFSGLIQVGDGQLTSAVPHATFIIAHEFGHLIAWHYGTDAFNGAGPAGFPYTGQMPEEMWADCVAQAFTGSSYPTPGLHGCPSDALAFTTQFLTSGPGAKLR